MKKRFILIGLLAALTFSAAALADEAGPKRAVSDFTLKSATLDGKRIFIGVGGKIDRKINPTLFVKEWEVVQITLINMDGLPHHIALPDFFILSPEIKEMSQKTMISFVPFKSGGFPYYCGLEGHRQLGMEGQLVILRR